MATIEEILQAAARADAAGDTEAARTLVAEARGFMAQVSGQQSNAAPQVDGPIPPPRADSEAWNGPTTRMPERFGDTISEATQGPIAAFNAFSGGLMDQSKSPTMQMLPENMPGRGLVAGIGDAGGAALSGLGAVMAGAAGTVGEIVGSDRTQEGKLTRDLMMGLEVSAPELTGVSGAVRSAGAASKAVQGLERANVAPTMTQQAARAASDLGITPSLGMTGKSAAVVAAGLEKMPLSAGVIAKDAARSVSEIEGVFSRIKSGIGTSVSPASAGDALQGGLGKFVAGFENTSGRLFSEVDKKIPQTARFPIDNTAQAIAGAKSVFDGNPELAARLGVNKWDGIISEAGQAGISWPALKQFRTSVGKALGDKLGRTALSDEDLGRLKTLYGSLTEDMTAAALQSGKPAMEAWTRANNFYRSGAKRIERSLDASITAKTPERAFEAFSQLLQADRATSDIARVRQIKTSMPKEEWGTVSASIVDRLGKARAGVQSAEGDVFSPSAFLTNWNKMSPEARTILLPEAARIELAKLAKVAEAAKASGAERNLSNTGSVAALLAIGAGGGVAPLTTAGAVGGAYIGSKAMTSPLFLRALNNAARGDMRQMAAMSKGRGPFSEDAQTVMRLSVAEAATGGAASNTNARPREAVGR